MGAFFGCCVIVIFMIVIVDHYCPLFLKCLTRIADALDEMKAEKKECEPPDPNVIQLPLHTFFQKEGSENEESTNTF